MLGHATVGQLRAMLSTLPDERKIVIESCCGGGCVLTPQRIEKLKDETVIVITQDNE